MYITVHGSDFSPFSKGCIKIERATRNCCLLNAISSGEYAIYDFEVRADAKSISVIASIDNPAHRDIDVYVYNYGTRRETELLSKPELDARWIRWETVLVDEKWKTRSPEFLDAVTPNREFDLLGPYNIVRLLFYADPGVPPKNEVFKINSVTLRYETSVDLGEPDKRPGSYVWKEGNKLFASGTGYPPGNITNPGQARAMAIRAATLDAQRNVLAYLQEISLPAPDDDSRIIISGQLTGAVTENTEYFDDGSVRVTLAIPAKRLIKRSMR